MSNKIVATAYAEEQSRSYDESRFTTPQGKAFHALEVEQLMAVVKDLPVPSMILEVGCGTGRFIAILAQLGHTVRGIEPSTSMLAETRRKVEKFDNVELNAGEGAKLPYGDDQFDFVYAIRVLNQTGSKEYALRTIGELIRVTRPGGRALVEFVNQQRPFRRRYSPTRLSVRDVEEAVADHQNVRIIRLGAVLFFSQSVLNLAPAALLPLWLSLERRFARLLPRLSSRCYVTMEKADPENTCTGSK